MICKLLNKKEKKKGGKEKKGEISPLEESRSYTWKELENHHCTTHDVTVDPSKGIP